MKLWRRLLGARRGGIGLGFGFNSGSGISGVSLWWIRGFSIYSRVKGNGISGVFGPRFLIYTSYRYLHDIVCRTLAESS